MNRHIAFFSAIALSATACSQATESRTMDRVTARGDYLIGVCAPQTGDSRAFDLKISLNAGRKADGSWKAYSVTVKGTVGGRTINERANLVRVGYNYDVEPATDHYYGINYFNFVAHEGNPADRTVGLNYVDDATIGNFTLALTEATNSALGYSSVACTLQNRDEILKELDVGAW